MVNPKSSDFESYPNTYNPNMRSPWMCAGGLCVAQIFKPSVVVDLLPKFPLSYSLYPLICVPT
jgi:hypothetical protein